MGGADIPIIRPNKLLPAGLLQKLVFACKQQKKNHNKKDWFHFFPGLIHSSGIETSIPKLSNSSDIKDAVLSFQTGKNPV